MIQYIVIEKQQDEMATYGIAAMVNQTQFDRIDDVVTDQAEALRLASLLQCNGVMADQFRDVVLDFIAD